jgi:hypothetical protein
VRLTLPEGWKARLPKSDSASSAFGDYRAEYTQTGRELRILRTLSGTVGVQPPEKIGELLAWMKQMSADDAKYIILEP